MSASLLTLALFFSATSTATLTAASTVTAGASEPPVVHAWPEEIRRTFISLLDQGGISLMNAVFDAMGRFDVFGISILPK
ncbi:MAG: hypothetical protein EOP04_33845 [Proteobacteria bacterium]|nr:MAG: hypothetical protein EOP04_33845 [Pseudomonadota bacterium]